VRLDDVRGFVFDVDGTLVRRYPDGVHPMPGAVEVLNAIRDSGRKLAIFTNGSHLPPEEFARELRADGLPVSDEEIVTPVRSALSYLRRRHDGAPVLLFARRSARCWSARG
jgi:ribonucleotide monophosphatase NagD (HAD superfamily)